MSAVAKLVMRRFYRAAEGKEERLPWHQEEPSKLLAAAVAARQAERKDLRALDVGCGAGVFTVWMAKQGLQVTGIDMFPEAIAMARSRAERQDVKVDLVTGDLFQYRPPQPFDLVLDSGCLHSLVGGDLQAYRRQLMVWLAPTSDYVLGHWGKRHVLDWRPMGPRRRSAAAIERLFAPELGLRDTEVTDFPVPLPFGPVVRGIGYWFRRVPGR